MEKSKHDPKLERQISEVINSANQKLFDQLSRRKRPTILVAGYTGTGKTSLIQAICGKHIVPDDCIGAGLPKTQAFDFYQDQNIRFFDSKGLEIGISEESFFKETTEFLKKIQEKPNVDEHVHLVWYAIQTHVTPCDLRLINKIFKNVIVVITKKDITKDVQFEGMRNYLIEESIEPGKILACSMKDQLSLKKLIELSYDLLPEAYRDAFVSAQMLNIEKKKKRAHFIIHTAAAVAAGIGAANPLPIGDAVLIAPVQFTMINELGRLMGEDEGKIKKFFEPAVISALGKTAASAGLKIFPGIGNMINAAVASSLTEALGWKIWKDLKKRLESRINGIEVGDFDEVDLKREWHSGKTE